MDPRSNEDMSAMRDLLIDEALSGSVIMIPFALYRFGSAVPMRGETYE